MTFTLGVSGTQNGSTVEQRWLFAKLLWEAEPSQLRHGDCIGVDKEMHDIYTAIMLHGGVFLHPASGVGHKRAHVKRGVVEVAREFPPLIRNTHIVDNSDFMAFFPQNEKGEILRSGTWATIRYARDAQTDHLIIRPSGRIDPPRSNGLAYHYWQKIDIY